ncbi:MAG: transcription factor S [Candidatus Lokiarchaeota archaeon]|nr:transcription factor S [Candidatus Lokiarchaeota archaeon]MBD3340566.1 transcription factor S [Candidatus Lokiarchaeota archaeon]
MEFCDECGGMMLVTKDDNGKKIFKCKCGAIKLFNQEKEEDYKISKRIKQPIRNEVVNVETIMKWKEENLKSSIKNFKCSRCGYDKAHLETRQTRSADEGMTHFITCLKCGKMRKIGS